MRQFKQNEIKIEKKRENNIENKYKKADDRKKMIIIIFVSYRQIVQSKNIFFEFLVLILI